MRSEWVTPPEELHRELSRRGFNTTVTRREYAQIDFADKGFDWAIRMSPHYYNTEDEVSAFVAAMAELSR